MRNLLPSAVPLDVLIVASWYPGVDDTARGRFVADQAEALFRTGRARPLVASFDPALADGEFLTRPQYLSAVAEYRGATLSNRGDALNPRGWGSMAGIPVARTPMVEGPGNAASNDLQGELRRGALLDLVKRLEAGPRGVVHAHTGYPDGYAAVAVARRLRWPLVITEHATFVQRQLGRTAQRRGYLEAVSAASRFLAVSDALADELRASVPGIGDKLLVVHNAVALDDFTPSGPGGRRPEELLFVGYRRERKGIVTLLEAFADVLEERPNATLRLLGRSLTDADERRWHELAEELEIGHAVTFEPPADRPGVAAAMARAGLLVHASHRETFGITTIEALASGLPVVAARAGGISGILSDPALGALVPPQDSRYLSRAILRTLARREEFDPAYLRAAAEPYAASAVADQLLSIYHEILGEAPAGAEGLRWEARAEPMHAALLILAFEAERAARLLEALPIGLRARLVVVTGAPEASLPSGIGRVVDASRAVEDRLRAAGLHSPRGGAAARVRRLLRNPIAPIRRRLTAGGLYELRQRAIRGGMLAAVEASGVLPQEGDSPPAPEVICMDAGDYLVAQPLAAAGRVRPAPGGIVWLADRWLSLQDAAGSDTPSRERTSDAIQSPSTGQ